MSSTSHTSGHPSEGSTLSGLPEVGLGTPPIAVDDLPGGARQILVAARKAGGWFCWTAGGSITKPVKVMTSDENGGAGAVYEDRAFPRCLVKGVHADGRAFVVAYMDGKVDACYHLSHHHTCIIPGALRRGEGGTVVEEPGTPYEWTTEVPSFEPIPVTALKKSL